MHKLKIGKPSTLGDFNFRIDVDFFLGQEFRLGSANSKTFVLLLAQRRPRSFISGAEIALGPVLQLYNRSEFHHLFPRRFLLDLETDDWRINSLANFAFLNRSENNRIGGRRPSLYRALMPADAADILDRALCPSSLWSDDYDHFVMERAELLLREAAGLIGLDPRELGSFRSVEVGLHMSSDV